MTRRVALILNPAAGGGRAARTLPAVERTLEAAGVEHTSHHATDVDHARALAREAASDGIVAVALGGDGLVGALAGALAPVPGAVLGILPCGRGNDLARVLGIPRRPLDACAVLAGGVEREIDLGAAGDHLFAGVASAGFDSDANRIANTAPAWLGQLVYLYGALRALAAWRPATFQIVLDGQEHSFHGYGFAAANSGTYGGGMRVAPEARLDDGMLDIVMISDVAKPRFLVLLPSVFRGTHVRISAVRVLRGRELRVSADRPFQVYADGDAVAELPLELRAVPRAIRVLVPA